MNEPVREAPVSVATLMLEAQATLEVRATLEAHAGAGHAIKHRCFDKPVPRAAHIARVVLIGHDDDQVSGLHRRQRPVPTPRLLG